MPQQSPTNDATTIEFTERPGSTGQATVDECATGEWES
jgi:hypothetical protein